MSLRLLLVDDEAPARQRLRKLLRPLEAEGRVQVVGEATDGVEALDRLREDAVDLLLLDIQMPELTGFDVLERMDPEERPVVVFTTAYDAYALDAFRANAVDYLLKPISEDRLRDAVARAERLIAAPETRGLRDEKLVKLLDWLDERAEAPTLSAEPVEFLKKLSVPLKDRVLLVPVERLVSVEVQDGITRAYLLEDNGKPSVHRHIVNYTLDQLEAHLDPAEFMRVHRSAIIRLDHIREVISWFSGRYKLVLTGNHEVIASRDRSRALKKKLML